MIGPLCKTLCPLISRDPKEQIRPSRCISPTPMLKWAGRHNMKPWRLQSRFYQGFVMFYFRPKMAPVSGHMSVTRFWVVFFLWTLFIDIHKFAALSKQAVFFVQPNYRNLTACGFILTHVIKFSAFVFWFFCIVILLTREGIVIHLSNLTAKI